jgi:hypothetical protein
MICTPLTEPARAAWVDPAANPQHRADLGDRPSLGMSPLTESQDEVVVDERARRLSSIICTLSLIAKARAATSVHPLNRPIAPHRRARFSSRQAGLADPA